MTKFGLQFNRTPQWRYIVYGFLDLIEAMVKILGLGFVYPLWSMNFAVWNTRRRINQRANAPSK